MTQATDDVYYLYVGNGWSGPFRVDQIRLFVKEKQISIETYAFEPQQQMQLTVAQLLVAPAEADTGSYQNPTAPPSTAATIKPSAAPDPQDARRTMVVPVQGVGGSATSTTATSSSSRAPIERQTHARTATRTPRVDDDVIDLDRVATTTGSAGAGSNKKAPRDDSDVIDLDAINAKNESSDTDAGGGDKSGANGDLTIEIDEPRGRPAESTVHTRASATEALEVVLGELETLRKAYNALIENSIKDREDAQQRVRVSHLAINEVLEERKSDIAEIRSLVAEIDQVASDLAKRSRDSTLSTRIIRLRDSLQQADVTQMVQFAEAVLRRIVEQSDRQSQRLPTVDTTDPFSVFDAGSGTGAAAGAANQATQLELSQLQVSYDRLHERLHQEQEAAKERLLNATMLLESERTMRSQDQAELRSLITEVYRLACEIDPKWMTKELYGRVQQLWGQLAVPEQGTAAAAMAPLADEVVQGLVHTLKERALSAPSSANEAAQEIGTQRRLAAERAQELSTLRADLLQTRTDLSLLKQREQALEEEKARLTRLLDEQKVVAEKSQQAAKAREQRLRSTVTALEVTKELHQEVMRDLQTQLAAAEGRVESMELELRDVRGQLTARRERRDTGDDLQAEMRRVVETRAMLDARKQELSADLKNTEAELERVGSSGEDGGDRDLAEALAAKVNHLRKTYEQTLARLNDQEAKAESLSAALEESRKEAGLLRSRSDDLNTELTEARANLSSAKKRVDELHQAYQRLESERESLQNELTVRRTTTTVFHQDSDGPLPPPLESQEQDLSLKLEAEARLRSSVETDLSRERRRAEDLMTQAHALQSRVTELTLDRDHIKAEHERLVESQIREAERLNAALSTATQTVIESEARQRQTEARISNLESELTSSGHAHDEAAKASAAGSVRLEKANASELASLRAERERLTSALAEAQQEQQRSLALLADAKRAVEQAGRQATLAAAQAASHEAASIRADSQKRLDEAERDIHTAAVQRDQVRTRLAAAEAEIERLHRERESAAAEHRAALQSARNRLAEEQSRAEGLARELLDLRSQVQGLTVNRDLVQQQFDALKADAASERAVNASEISRLSGVAAELGRARIRLQELSDQLTTEQAGNAEVATQLPELESRLTRSQAERSQLLAELDRLRSEVVTLTQQHEGADQAAALTVQLEALTTAKSASDAQLSTTQAGLAAAHGKLSGAQATIERLTTQVSQLSTAAKSASEAHSTLESRHTIAAKRLAAADQLLAQARDQQHKTSSALDAAQLAVARLEAERAELADEAKRLRTTLESVRSEGTSKTSKGSAMLDLAERQVHDLEQQLAHANVRLRELESRPAATPGERPVPQTPALVDAHTPVQPQPPTLALAGEPSAAFMALQERLTRLEAALAPTIALVAATSRLGSPAPAPTVQATAQALTTVNPQTHGQEPAHAGLQHYMVGGSASAGASALAAPAPAGASLTSRQGRFTASHGRTFLGGEPATQVIGTRFGQGRGTGTFRPGPSAHTVLTRPVGAESVVTAPLAGLAPGAALMPNTQVLANPAQLTGDGQTGIATLAMPSGGTASVFGTAPRPMTSAFATTRQTWRTVSPPTATIWQRSLGQWQQLSMPSRLLIGIAAGSVVLVSAVWAMAMGLPATQTAVVNADVAVVKAPIEGVVQELPIATGATLRQGALAVHIHNDLVDDTHLRELKTDLRDAHNAKDAADTALSEISAQLAGKIRARDLARAAALASAQKGRTAAVQALADATEMVKLRQLVLTTLQTLVAAGRLQDDDLQASHLLAAKADTDLQQAKAALAQAETAVATAQDNDEKAQAEIDEVQSQVDLAKAQVATQITAITSGEAAITTEEAHLASLRDASLTSPLSGPIWVQKATAGAQVQAGAPVLEIADPSTIAIEAVFTPASAIHVGDNVRVRLPSSGSMIDGRIRSFAQDGDAQVTRAEDLGPQAPEAVRATIDLDTPVAKTALLGQGCEVVVIGDHSLLGSCVGWLYFRLKF